MSTKHALFPDACLTSRPLMKGGVEGKVKKALAVKLSGHKSVDQTFEPDQIALTVLPDGKVRCLYESR